MTEGIQDEKPRPAGSGFIRSQLGMLLAGVLVVGIVVAVMTIAFGVAALMGP